MTKKTRKIFPFLTLACSLCVGMGVSIGLFNASAQVVQGTATYTEALKTKYMLGDVVTVPSATLEYEGSSVNATDVYVLAPNGTTMKTQEVTLTQSGEYTVVYSAEQNGKTITAQTSFEVNASAYSVSSTESSVQYRDELELVTAINDKRIEMNPEKTPELIKTTSGLDLTLVSGDTFNFNKSFNVHSEGGVENFITLFYWQWNTIVDGWSSMQQANQIHVRLTDAYNPEVYVDYLMNWQDGGAFYLYTRVSTNTNSSVGLNSSSTAVNSSKGTKITYNDVKYRVYKNEWGANTNSTQYLSHVKYQGMTFGYDASEKQAWQKDAKGTVGLINDLDLDMVYAEEEFFRGFTTGEVFLSIYAEDFVSDELRLEINTLGDLTGEALNFNAVDDMQDPTLIIENDLENYGEMKLALGEEFVVPNAIAWDVNLVGDVTKAVYINYGETAESRIAIIDGKFTPKRQAKYTVEYTAKDAFGNTTVKTLDFQCVKTDSGKGIDFSVNELSALNAGYEIALPKYVVSGLNKTPAVKISYVGKDAEGNVLQSGVVEENAFRPLYEGTYVITYEYTDGVKSYVYSYEVDSSASDAIAAVNAVALPKYLLKGYKYNFDKYYVSVFDSGEPVNVLAKLELSVDNGSFKESSYENVSIMGSRNVKARYSYGNWTSEEYEMKIVDAGKSGTIKMEEYFQGNFDKESMSEELRYVAKAELGSPTLEFVNPISVSNFVFKFKIPNGYGNFERIVITLTDFYNAENVIEIVYYQNKSGKIVYSVNGIEISMQVSGFTGVLRNTFYTWANQAFTDTNAGNIEYPIDFVADKAFLSVTLENATGPSAIYINTVNNQSLTNLEVDSNAPQLRLDKTEGGLCELNTVVTLHAGSLIDVLTPSLSENLTVTVKAPDGKVVKTLDGTPIQDLHILEGTYFFKADGFGTYNVYYRYSDQSGNSSQYRFKVIVNDANAPVISLSEKKTTSAKVGETVKIADYVLSDDISEAKKIVGFVTITTANGEVLYVKSGVTAFKPTSAGVWTINYFAFDEAGNMTMISYEIVVK